MLGAAAQGNVAAIQRFDDLGLSVTKLLAHDPRRCGSTPSPRRLGEQTDQAELAGKAFEVLGRSIAPLLPTIKALGGNMEDFVAKAKKAGNALTDEEIEKVHEWDSAWVDATSST